MSCPGATIQNFFLMTIAAQLQSGLTKPQLLAYYHGKIAERQQRRAKQLIVVFDKIDNLIRNMNVETPDANVETSDAAQEQLIITANTKTLIDLEKEIRQGAFNKDVEFLDALKKVFDYNLDE
jgi:hypothetical protein